MSAPSDTTDFLAPGPLTLGSQSPCQTTLFSVSWHQLGSLFHLLIFTSSPLFPQPLNGLKKLVLWTHVSQRIAHKRMTGRSYSYRFLGRTLGVSGSIGLKPEMTFLINSKWCWKLVVTLSSTNVNVNTHEIIEELESNMEVERSWEKGVQLQVSCTNLETRTEEQ